MPLVTTNQEDFSAGMVRAVARHLIPPNGAFDIENGLLDDDGSVYRRGGGAYLSTANFGASGLRFIWDGTLLPGHRTLIADPSNFAVLDAAEAPVNIGNAGTGGLSAPASFGVVGDMLFIAPGKVYGGSRKTVQYLTGTVAVTNGSRIVAGSGTGWGANVDAGMIFQRGPLERMYVVESVDHDTQVKLNEPYEGATAAGQTYTMWPIADVGYAANFYSVGDHYAAVANRLAAAHYQSGHGWHVHFSQGISATGASQVHNFLATNRHQVPEGAVPIGLAPLRDSLVIFTTKGLWVAQNMSFDLTDDFGNPQQRLERFHPELVLWSATGTSGWANSLVVPALDGVWLLDLQSPPRRISDAITPLYLSYVRSQAFRCGQASVYRGHYFLPILNSSGTMADLLVCRLDSPSFPWVRMSGSGAKVTALSLRVGGTTRDPELLGAAGEPSAPRVLKLAGFFEPDATRKADQDGTVPRFRVISRDFATGKANVKNLTRRLRIRYELVDAGSDNPSMQAYYSVGTQGQAGAQWGNVTWGSFTWADALTGDDRQLEGSAPEGDGREAYTWHLQARSLFIRARIQTDSPSAKAAIRSIEWFTRPSRKQ